MAAAGSSKVFPVPEESKNERDKPSAKASTSGLNDTQNQARQNKPKCKLKLRVYNLPPLTTEQSLKDAFCEFGPITVATLGPRYAILVCGSPKKRDDALLKEFRINGLKVSVKAERPFGSRHNNHHQLPKPEDLDLSGDPAAQLQRFLSSVRLQHYHLRRLMDVIADVEKHLQAEFKGCRAIPFGSLCTGLGLLGSDADCFVQLQDCPAGVDQGDIVMRAQRLLRKKLNVFGDVLAITQAHTPIVKLFHYGTGTPCDVTFKTRLGIRNSELVAALFQRDARFMPMAVIIKYWASVQEVNGSGKLSNYALTMLIVFFLQQLKLLPSIASMQSRAEPHIVDGWNTAFEEHEPSAPRKDYSTVHSLVGRFFHYYSLYDLDTLAICPLIGRPVKKSVFNKTEELPVEFDRYRENMLSGASRPLRHQRPLLVQDPFEQCQNVASGISYKQSCCMTEIFAKAQSCYARFGESENFLPNLFTKIVIPEPVKKNFHPEFIASIDVRGLGECDGWMERTMAATKLVLEHSLLLRLEKLTDKGVTDPLVTKLTERYAATIECALWKRSGLKNIGEELVQSERRRSLLLMELAGEAGNLAVARAEKVWDLAVARAGKVGDNIVWLQVTLEVSAWKKSTTYGAEILTRLTEGNPSIFHYWSSFLNETITHWIRELLLRPHESGWDVEPLY